MIVVFTDSSSSRKFSSLGSACIIYKVKEVDFLNNNFKNKEELFKIQIGFKSTIKIGSGEMIGVLFALEWLIENNFINEKIILYSDSEYTIKELDKINGWWKGHFLKRFIDIKNKELIINIVYKLSLFKNILLFHVKGHTGKQDFASLGNNEVDILARAAHREDEGADLNDLFDYFEFIQEINKENQEENYFNKIYQTLNI